MKNNMTKPAGFTLAELIVVIIIISVLVTLAIPNIGLVMERSRTAEGEHYLFTLLAAQKRYSIDHDNGDATPDYAEIIDDLDVDVSQVLSNFDTPTDADVFNASRVAQIKRKDNFFAEAYTLHIYDTGELACGCALTSCPICQKLGYSAPH